MLGSEKRAKEQGRRILSSCKGIRYIHRCLWHKGKKASFIRESTLRASQSKERWPLAAGQLILFWKEKQSDLSLESDIRVEQVFPTLAISFYVERADEGDTPTSGPLPLSALEFITRPKWRLRENVLLAKLASEQLGSELTCRQCDCPLLPGTLPGQVARCPEACPVYHPPWLGG